MVGAESLTLKTSRMHPQSQPSQSGLTWTQMLRSSKYGANVRAKNVIFLQHASSLLCSFTLASQIVRMSSSKVETSA